MKRYLIFIWGDVEPQVFGPFDSDDDRDKKALELRTTEGESHGIYPADIGENGELSVLTYSGMFFEEVDK